MKLPVCIVFLFLVACGTNPETPYSDTPTSGKVNIGADETLLKLADAQLDTFHGLYRYASINMLYKPEAELFKMLLDDSVKVIMSARPLNAAEESYFKSRNLIPVSTRVAVDALAIIINKANPDSLMSLNQLGKILNGEADNWKSVFPGSALGKISFVFDNNGSSTVRYLNDSLMKTDAFPEWCFAAKSNEDVIKYVESNPSAMGIIGVSWISDEDDAAVKDFLTRIKVMALSRTDSGNADDYFKPYQAYISLNDYPLTRDIYMISREGRAGLGTGFVSFVAGDQGQRIIRLMGLLPATMPVRIIKTQ